MNNYKIYVHTTPEKKHYIGITKTNTKFRWQQGKGYKRCRKFNEAIDKFGWDNIEHKILFDNLSKEDALNKEIELISKYQSNDPNYGYNISPGGNVVSNETKKIISVNTKKAMNNPKLRLKLSNAQKGKTSPMKGKKLSEEHKAKLNHYGMLGKKHSIETIKKISIKATGKKHSIQAKKRMSKSHIGKIMPQEVKDKISKSIMGHPSYTKGKILSSRKEVKCIETNTIYDSLTEAFKKTGISMAHISGCCKKKYGRKTAGGYHWQYESEEK